jgi:hypothetical protein
MAAAPSGSGVSRWSAGLAVLFLIALPLLLPDHLRLGPPWLLAAIGSVLLTAMALASWRRLDRAVAIVRHLTIGLTVVLILGAGWMTARLTVDLVEGGPSASSAPVLLSTGGLVWVNNCVLFALLYWELEGGSGRRDFAFPQHMSPELGALVWRPAFVDYLYVGFTNGLAFSPTDAMPLTPAAKLTMATQAVVSFLVLGLVIARAVNVLT